MSHPISFNFARAPLPDNEQKQTALNYLSEAWAEARHDGVDGDCLAQASLFAALAELVKTYGEDAVAKSIEIHWPSGTRQTLQNVRGDQILSIDEPSASNAKQERH